MKRPGSAKKADAVFEGGGVKGIGLVGALAVAEEQGYEWVNIAGTSAGAIVAALLAAGYRAAELRKILEELDYKAFKDRPVGGSLLNLVRRKGLYRGRYFEDWLHGLLKERGVVTFGDLLREDEAEDRYRYRLNVVASDITRGRLLVLPQDAKDYRLDPSELVVSKAVRMSMSIPFFFEPAMLGNSHIVDGGLLSNFPVFLFDSQGTPEWPTFGFKLVEPGSGRPRKIRTTLHMIGALISTMLEAHDQRHLDDADFVRTVPIKTLGVGTTEFDLSRERAQMLYDSGRRAAETFFRTWNWEEYLVRYRTAKPDGSPPIAAP